MPKRYKWDLVDNLQSQSIGYYRFGYRTKCRWLSFFQKFFNQTLLFQQIMNLQIIYWLNNVNPPTLLIIYDCFSIQMIYRVEKTFFTFQFQKKKIFIRSKVFLVWFSKSLHCYKPYIIRFDLNYFSRSKILKKILLKYYLYHIYIMDHY